MLEHRQQAAVAQCARALRMPVVVAVRNGFLEFDWQVGVGDKGACNRHRIAIAGRSDLAGVLTWRDRGLDSAPRLERAGAEHGNLDLLLDRAGCGPVYAF